MTDVANTNAAYIHAVITITDHQAQIVRFDGDGYESRSMKAKSHETRQHNSDVRDVHEFFAEVCDDLENLDQALVTGNHVGLADFKHYVMKHRPALTTHILGYEKIDHPSDGELVDFARSFLKNHERLAH